jgi:hypothetical protein
VYRTSSWDVYKGVGVSTAAIIDDVSFEYLFTHTPTVLILTPRKAWLTSAIGTSTPASGLDIRHSSDQMLKGHVIRWPRLWWLNSERKGRAFRFSKASHALAKRSRSRLKGTVDNI